VSGISGGNCMMDLFSILACPTCKVNVQRQGNLLVCSHCHRTYPVVNGVPVFLTGGAAQSTQYQHQHDLIIRDTYDPWVHRVVLQSLPANAIMLEIGAGNQALNLPNVIRMDVTLTPYVDVVGDAHMLPFLPGTFDFIFSLAVMEHLRQPFVAAQEMYDALRNGGYVCGDCCFVFAYHGFPHHYFNASRQGLQQVFAQFEEIRSGIAPYQMPSLALLMVLSSYLKSMTPIDDPNVAGFRLLLREVLDQPLGTYDGLFTEENAFNVAAGVSYFGRKASLEPSDVIPRVIQTTWETELSVKSRFSQLFDIGTAPNIMIWAKDEGRKQFSAIDEWYKSMVPFRKNTTVDNSGLEKFNVLPVISAIYGSIPSTMPVERQLSGDAGLRQRLEKVALQNERLESKVLELTAYTKRQAAYIDEKEAYIKRLEHLAGESTPHRIYRRLKRLVLARPKK
jgi:uncharacterized protein YbaR (Trm112 family)